MQARQLSLSGKVFLICASFLIPILFLLYITVSAYNKDINFARLEVEGNVYIHKVIGVLENLYRHKLSVKLFHLGHLPHRQDIDALQVQITKKMEELKQTDDRIGPLLQFTLEGLGKRGRSHLRMDRLIDKWGQLQKATLVGFDKATADLYDSFISDLRGVINHAGDTSNLILDPDLDSYYLMDVMLLALPQMQDRVQQVYTFMVDLKQNGLGLSQRIQAGIYKSLLNESDLSRITGGVQTALNEDQNFHGLNSSMQQSLPPAVKQLEKFMAPMMQTLAALEGEGIAPSSIQEVIEVFSKAQSESFGMWYEVAKRLDELLIIRISTYESQKTWAFYLSLCGVTAAFIFLLLSIRSISKHLSMNVDRLVAETVSINEIAQKVLQSSNFLSQSVSKQAAAIQQTVSSMQEISSMISKTSDQTKIANQDTHAMEMSMQVLQNSNRKLKNLVETFKEIDSKTKVINDIVFKTQLLSFNASIEAARAGTYGKGFAVVAQEVGKLADLSGSAAYEINQLLSNSDSYVRSTVEETSASIEGFEKVIRMVAMTTDAIGIACAEQETGVRQTNIAMDQIDAITNENSHNSNEMASISIELQRKSDVLKQVVHDLNGIINGNAA